MSKYKRHGPGLKPGVNEADTGSRVGKVKGAAKTGRVRAVSEKARSMVAGNASVKRKH